VVVVIFRHSFGIGVGEKYRRGKSELIRRGLLIQANKLVI
jgi:hypothetical protein